MQIQIFDVEHGFCALVIADNGNTMLIDCGHNSTTGFHPADYLLRIGCTGIERFFVTNYDEDHISGLPRLRQLQQRIPIQILHRNKSLSHDQLSALKRQGGPLGEGMKALLEMIASYTGEVTQPPEFPSLDFETYRLEYPTFSDTNNLSLVLFLHFPGLSIIFPGDMEKAGWRHLLQRQAFRNSLKRVNIFVASHHGRESGYLAEVFDHCTPDVVVISDTRVQYETQENKYRNHAAGITWNGTETRRVLTTRKDGMLTISNTEGGGYFINASK